MQLIYFKLLLNFQLIVGLSLISKSSNRNSQIEVIGNSVDQADSISSNENLGRVRGEYSNIHKKVKFLNLNNLESEL
ncbi:hypothetical protein CONCODRAFT_88135 [Conidiobolus coronatus NRRL 28638]|uniref:Uncharacterized protein n=1 Tax=Conidiobolus coronatus (strain ATCC 28846 / CBS 209.66 / NRRL 28638) TaxID=796925 RepID=A0A137PJ09_CONC2|nr:hypothetical protein CONCODRAFT_88135 [Conidiobolus coronatus NRRL 28638]|eukprot:KXN74982.1 hypothetical protein CONCODRAFT_88135 [Conidiobolus coronatus NRRL 28638]